MTSANEMPGDLWYPLLALIECGDGAPSPSGSLPAEPTLAAAENPPSPELREAILRLRAALQREFVGQIGGKQFWLLLDTGHSDLEYAPSPLEVGRVLEELRQKFQELRPLKSGEQLPDFEGFLREKMRALGFDDLGTAPLLPELQREALRGLGVGLGSQMAQLLGRLAGWHGEVKPAKKDNDEETKASGHLRLLRLEVGPALASDRAYTTLLRGEVHKLRRRASQRLGWEVSGVGLAVNKELGTSGWRLLLRGSQVASGDNAQQGCLLESLETVLADRAEALLPFADFEGLLRQPGCKLVVKELRALGLEKAALWTVCRRVLASGGHLREPLTVLERILEASVIDQQLPFLVQAVIGPDSSEGEAADRFT